jgi:hypothetical protein
MERNDNAFWELAWLYGLWKKSNVMPAPKGNSISKELAVSLKRYPDTKPLFSAACLVEGVASQPAPQSVQSTLLLATLVTQITVSRSSS